MAITKLKRGETYFYVDSWTGVRGEPGVMVPAEVIEIQALTNGAKQPRAKYIGGEGCHGAYGFTIFFGSEYADNAVWATREEAEAATFIDHDVKKFHDESAA
ncbi:MAG: hypothetical protein VW757_06640 [Halieaceae bacterium]